MTKSRKIKQKVMKNVPKNLWLKDLQAFGNVFVLESCLRFLGNLCERYRGTLNDTDAFAPVVKLIRREKVMAIFYSCTTKAVRIEMESREYEAIRLPESEVTSDLFIAMWRHCKSNEKFRLELSSWLVYARNQLCLFQNGKSDPVKGRFEELKRLFTLSDREIDILIAATAIGLGIWPCLDFKNKLTCDKIARFAALMGIAEADYQALIKPSGKLRRFCCLNEDGDLNLDLLPFISGVEDQPLVSRYFKKNETEALPWSFFGTLAEWHGEFLKRLIDGCYRQRGMNILLYGEPGTGKTSFAVSLASQLGRTPYFIAQSDDSHNDSTQEFRFAALQICDSQIDPAQSLIVVDEADRMLDSNSSEEGHSYLSGGRVVQGDKGVLNDVLDTMKTPCIWITNAQADALDASSRRRFDYSIRFDKLTCEQREMIWRNAVRQQKAEKVISDAAVTRFSARYAVSAGGISVVTT